MGSSSLNKNNYDSILELLDFLCLNPKNTVKYLDLLIVILNVLELECEKIP